MGDQTTNKKESEKRKIDELWRADAAIWIVIIKLKSKELAKMLMDGKWSEVDFFGLLRLCSTAKDVLLFVLMSPCGPAGLGVQRSWKWRESRGMSLGARAEVGSGALFYPSRPLTDYTLIGGLVNWRRDVNL